MPRQILLVRTADDLPVRKPSRRPNEENLSRHRIASLPVAIAACVFLTGARALPGDHHSDASLRCSDCHVMHYSQVHGYSPGGGGPWSPLGGGGPQRALLRNRVNDLCLACHDASGLATDVLGAANTGSQPGIVRGAGYLNRLGLVGLEGSGHTLDSNDLAPGSQPGWSPSVENAPGEGLTCINCHDAHGEPGIGHPTGSQYRNLRSDPGYGTSRWLTYNQTSPGVNDFGRDAFLRALRSYDESQVDWNEPDPQSGALAVWCGGCHTIMHGNVLDGSGASGPGAGGLPEHPVYGTDLEPRMLTRYNSLANRVKVTSEVGIWNPAGPDVTPTCSSCHRAHGNGNRYGLIFRSGTGIATENGDSNGTSRADLCRQCHVEPTRIFTTEPLIQRTL